MSQTLIPGSILAMTDQAAQRLLKESNAAISEIARSCGYTDSKYFHKQFKRYVGMSPGKWRQTGTWKEDSND